VRPADICLDETTIISKTNSMRKLKLQIHMSLDGFVAGPNGELDWQWLGKPDETILQRIIELADSCDTILMGRKMTRGFIDHWENNLDHPTEGNAHPLAKRMVTMRKIVFSHTETDIKGRNLEVENGNLAAAVKSLKKQSGKDLLVYGGADFVSSLIMENLIDEYYIFRKPVAIGNGLSIFKERKLLELESSVIYKNGTILTKFLPL
jgi:dihydrofolate reductase